MSADATLRKPGRPRRGEERKGDTSPITRGTGGVAYLAARLRRDDPELADEVERGRLTVREAAKRKGWIKPPTLAAAWAKATREEREAFLGWLAERERHRAQRRALWEEFEEARRREPFSTRRDGAGRPAALISFTSWLYHAKDLVVRWGGAEGIVRVIREVDHRLDETVALRVADFLREVAAAVQSDRAGVGQGPD